MSSQCQRCRADAATASIMLGSNVSYLVGRFERQFKATVCAKCALLLFAKFEGATLVGTWWAIVGIIRGFYFLMRNIVELGDTLVTIRKRLRLEAY